jgi:hypothetical protein
VKVRFQADADLNQIIVKAILRKEPAVDFKTATEAKLEGQNDIDVLKIATQEDRVLVSHDQRTMPSHFANYIIDKASSGVILVSKKMSIAEAVEEIILIWELSEAHEWINRIAKLPL